MVRVQPGRRLKIVLTGPIPRTVPVTEEGLRIATEAVGTKLPDLFVAPAVPRRAQRFFADGRFL
jgi:hypothetical protein